MLKIVGIVFIVLAISAIGFAYYMGFFSAPQVTEKFLRGYVYAYEEFIGDYKKTGPVFDRVSKVLLANGVNTSKGIGVYFDNPQQVEVAKLRSHCGAVIEAGDFPKVDEIANMLKVGKISESNSMVVDFPIKNQLSYIVGPIKAYPVLMRYAQEKKYKVITVFELYDIPARKISYVMQFSE